MSVNFRITAVDLLGMGFSDKPKDHHYSICEQCNYIESLAKDLNIESAHIIAHDLGTAIAQEFLSRSWEGKLNFQVHSIAFLNGALFMSSYKPRFIQKLLSQSPSFIGKTISKIISIKSLNKSVKEVFGPKTQPSDEFLDQQWGILNYNQGKLITYLIGRMVFERFQYQKRWIESMQKTSIPICYICGPADPNSGIKMAEMYKKLVPKPVVYLLDKEIGHWPHLEASQETIKIIENFLKRV